MASEEHIKLASFIKSVHKSLRSRVQSSENADNNVDMIWSQHLDNEEVLRQYAEAMRQLATQHWKDDTDSQSRIHWVHSEIEKYFYQGGVNHELTRDTKFARRKDVAVKLEENITQYESLHVIDVGSCYNPFSIFSTLDVLAVDIAPATSEVVKCDFLSVPTSDKTVICQDENKVNSLQRAGFHVVIFCLLLEYLPSPAQRYDCVKKAVSLLSENGLLCIVTPDSSHQAKNLEMIKSWRRGLNSLGMRQVTYGKAKHFHGLVFRKPCTIIQDLTMKDVDCVSKDITKYFFIPQDEGQSTEVDNNESELIHHEIDRGCIISDFEELPSLDL